MSYTVFETELSQIERLGREELKSRSLAATCASAALAIGLSWVFADDSLKQQGGLTVGTAVAIVFLLVAAWFCWRAAEKQERDRSDLIKMIKDESRDY